MADRKTEIEKLTIGSEYPRGTIEGQVEVKVGDNLFEKLAGILLIVKDGIVVEIRQQKVSPEDVLIPQPRILQPGQ